MYNKNYAYQIYENDGNALVICVCGSYEYHEMRIVHHWVQFVAFFHGKILIESHFLANNSFF